MTKHSNLTRLTREEKRGVKSRPPRRRILSRVSTVKVLGKRPGSVGIQRVRRPNSKPGDTSPYACVSSTDLYGRQIKVRVSDIKSQVKESFDDVWYRFYVSGIRDGKGSTLRGSFTLYPSVERTSTVIYVPESVGNPCNVRESSPS